MGTGPPAGAAQSSASEWRAIRGGGPSLKVGSARAACLRPGLTRRGRHNPGPGPKPGWPGEPHASRAETLPTRRPKGRRVALSRAGAGPGPGRPSLPALRTYSVLSTIRYSNPCRNGALTAGSWQRLLLAPASLRVHLSSGITSSSEITSSREHLHSASACRIGRYGELTGIAIPRRLTPSLSCYSAGAYIPDALKRRSGRK
jgi:hypothetical protein